MHAAALLAEAAELVGGERFRRHGPARQSLGLTAELWSAYLKVPIEAVDVALLMALLKVARAHTGALDPDHFLDLCGYGAIAGELATAAPPAASAP